MEYQDDVRDRQREADEQAAIERETDDLLKRQMDEMADVEAKGRAAGLLFDDAKKIKVAIGASTSQPQITLTPSTSAATVKTETKPKPAPPRAAAASAFGADDEEDDVKKKRTLVRLDEDKSNIEAKVRAKLIEIRKGIPMSPAELWSYKLKWEGLTQVSHEWSVQVCCRLIRFSQSASSRRKSSRPFGKSSSVYSGISRLTNCSTLLSSMFSNMRVLRQSWKAWSR